jgi:hypothetical protein
MPACTSFVVARLIQTLSEQHMAELVNLRLARKRALRQAREHAAEQNRIDHGRSSNSRRIDQARSEKTQRDLDAHRIDEGGK